MRTFESSAKNEMEFSFFYPEFFVSLEELILPCKNFSVSEHFQLHKQYINVEYKIINVFKKLTHSFDVIIGCIRVPVRRSEYRSSIIMWILNIVIGLGKGGMIWNT